MNIYLHEIQKISLSNKYTKFYIAICNRAILRASSKKDALLLFNYVEKHHILPKGFNLGGEKDKLNFAFLTAKEHFVCHRLLTKMLTGFFYSKMCWALKMLSYSKYGKEFRKITSRMYQKIKLDANVATSKALKGKPRKSLSIEQEIERRKKISNSLKGRKASEETKQLLRKPKSDNARKNMKGRIISDFTRQKLSNIHKGKIASDATKAKQSTSAKNKKPISMISRQKISNSLANVPKSDIHRKNLSIMQKNQPKVSCVCCKKTFDKRSFNHYHGIKCKDYNNFLLDLTKDQNNS